ncbi:hypothetical protein FKW77_010548 [Venturia effusa]|uniref:UDP-glycosyltransferases domain-containing protein n=1 Tax=Venturia effusa TaxID=50376 RepID=A0A517KXU5_9PEZI|nr:hypothetical protein FKW77_010548 [Venturia effusa]
MPRRGWITAVVLAIVAIIINSISNQKQDTSPRSIIPGRNNTALFISNAEYGQLNVNLAAAQALLLHHPNVEIHFATFGSRAKDIASINKYARLKRPTARSIIFHEVKSAPSYGDMMTAKGYTVESTINPPGYRGCAHLFREIQRVLYAWSGPQHIALFEELSRLIHEVNPSVVMVDTMFGPSMDAVRELDRRYAVLSPNALLTNFAEMQPYLSFLWKYPALGSAHPYPVPWHLIPLNIYINLRLAYSIYVNPSMVEMKKYLQTHGITKPVDIFSVYRPHNLTWISQGSLEADFPLPVIPDNVKAVGPILLASASAAEQDPELASWIQKAPTVMIHLGSHVDYDEKGAREMADAIRVLLEQTDVQVLWKFKMRRVNGTIVYSTYFVEEMMGENRARLWMTRWLSIDPPAMLETGNIAAAVTHGGASSFYEAMINGVPQVILPVWLDNYEFASRAECKELVAAFLAVLGNSSQAVQLRSAAKEFAKKFEGKPGREKAADIIAELAGLGEV